MDELIKEACKQLAEEEVENESNETQGWKIPDSNSI